MHLARDGWDVATFWRAYDKAMPHGSDPADVEWLHEQSSAAYTGDTEKLKTLLDGGASIDVRDEAGATPLHYATKAGQLEVSG